MRDGVRARVETDDDRQAIRVAADEGEVAVDGATFRFSLDRPGTNEATSTSGADAACNDSVDDTEMAAENASGEENGKAVDADDPRYVAAIEDVPTNGTIRCEALGRGHGVEFICRQEDGEASAWRNSCPHEPDVRLDPGWGAFVRDGQIVCHEHGARFETGDGLCTYGPCRGKVLDPIDVDVRGGAVYLTDERFEAARRLR